MSSKANQHFSSHPAPVAPRVFISHPAQDTEIAKSLAAELRRRGLTVWLDVESLSPGDDVAESITNALRQAKAAVVLIPEPASARAEVPHDWIAIQQQSWESDDLKVIPVAPAGVALPPFLRRWQSITKSSPKNVAEHVARVISGECPPLAALAESARELQQETAERFRTLRRVVDREVAAWEAELHGSAAEE